MPITDKNRPNAKNPNSTAKKQQTKVKPNWLYGTSAIIKGVGDVYQGVNRKQGIKPKKK